MSKTVPASLVTHYAGGPTSVAHAMFIEREDGQQFGFTEHDRNDTVDGFEYLADPGFLVSEIVSAVGCDVGSGEINCLHDGTIFTPKDVLEQRWRAARFQVFRYNHRATPPITDIDICFAGNFGEVELRNNLLKIEMHDLFRYMNQPVGSARSKECRYRLGSTSMAAGGLCMKDISGAPFTLPFEVTHVSGTARTTFRDDTLARPEDWFGLGYVRFESGDLEGVEKLVWGYTADGWFTLSLPTLVPIEVGMTGTAVVGCRKRRTEDCGVAKFDNAVNFGGEPDSRSVDVLTRSPTADALANAVIGNILG